MRYRNILAAVMMMGALGAQADNTEPDKEKKQALQTEIKPDPALVEYQKRLARLEREMEMLRQQNALLQAKISHIQTQRQYEQVISGALPGVLTVFKSGNEVKARVRYQTGIERVVGVGDPLNKRAVVASIDEKTGVIARVGRRKVVLDYISRNSNGAPGGLPSPVGGAPLPPPIMR